MRIFEIVKENVNLREAAELYGIDVNRYGKAHFAPFTTTGTPACMWPTIIIIASPAGSTGM